MNTSKIVLICVGAFFIVNFTLGWISWFMYQLVPDSLVDAAKFSGISEGVLSGAVGIAKIFKGKGE